MDWPKAKIVNTSSSFVHTALQVYTSQCTVCLLWLVQFSFFFCLHAQLWNFFGFVAPLSLKTPLKEYSSARARQVRRTVEFSGKLHRLSRSRKQRDRCWPRIRHYCAQSETSIWKSRGSCSLRLKSQGLSRPFWKTFRSSFFRLDWWPLLGIRGYSILYYIILYYIII